MGLQSAGQKLLGGVSPDALVLAIIIGVMVRGIEQFPKSVQRFSIKNCGEKQTVETQISDSIESHSALSNRWFDIRHFEAGIDFAARFLLELAVMLLGASLSVTILIESGLVIIMAVMILVTLAIATSYGLSRLLQLPPRLAFLIACGNWRC